MKIDCTHPRANHQHGTYLAYAKDGCRCRACADTYRIYSKWVQGRTISGNHTYVDAGRAREHVLALLGVLTVGQIEQRSGVHRTAIRVLVGDFPGRPASKRVTRATEAALLAVKPDRVGPEGSGWLDRSGTQRRLRGLMALGWTRRSLSRRLGSLSDNLGKLTADTGSPVLASTRAKVCDLYDELALVIPPPSRGATLARNLARRKGWVTPLAWDDDTIDDPAAQPCLDRRVERSRKQIEEVLEDFEDTYWEHQGNLTLAGLRLDYDPVTLERALYRARANGAEVSEFYRSTA